MKEIPLTKGKVAIVDDCDFEELNKYKWYAAKSGNYCYAARSITVKINVRKTIFMAHVIMKPAKGYCVDHINGDKLDNRRSNLRICTITQNNWNKKKWRKTASKYLGVYKPIRGNYWVAQIRKDSHSVYLGCFDTEEKAAIAYNIAAKKYRGNFAQLNRVIPDRAIVIPTEEENDTKS